jgi:hypothetical protein
VKKPAILLAFAVLLSLAVLAIAPAAIAKTQNISGTIKGTFVATIPATCASGYANHCESGNCETFQPAGGTTPTVSGSIGKGTVTSMCVTVDLGNNVNTPNDADGRHTCSPFYGDLTYERKKDSSVLAINIAGVACHHQPTSTSHLVEGGFGIDGANSTDTAATGWGTVTGTVDKSTEAFSLKVSGNLTP